MRFPDVPACERPDAGIVVVTWNGRDRTAQALEALVAVTPPVYQLVVVDNGSEDGTAEAVREMRGATTVLNPGNLGFGPAASQGARLVAARHLVFLNDDAVVRAGWLEALLATADADPGVAAVGARLLHPDGRLQEAGSILWREGRVLNYGDGDDPRRHPYRFAREVDYASAACLLVRRSAFTAAGGFDPGYAPAYLEDVDLCLALAEAGGRVVHQPLAEAVHARGSSLGDERRVQARVAANLPRLRARWAHRLARRPPEAWYRDASGVLAGRDAPCAERLLVITASVPAAGAVASLLATLRRLRPRDRLTLLALSRGGSPAALEASGVEVNAGEEEAAVWLRERRRHYGLVVVAADLPPTVAGALAAHQPQAAVVTLGQAVCPGGMRHRFALGAEPAGTVPVSPPGPQAASAAVVAAALAEAGVPPQLVNSQVQM